MYIGHYPEYSLHTQKTEYLWFIFDENGRTKAKGFNSKKQALEWLMSKHFYGRI